jgi:hypothetical protein
MSFVLEDVLPRMIRISAQFIATASCKGHEAINHTPLSKASGIQVTNTNHPMDNHVVVFLDTPGFDDSPQSGADVLYQISDWLKR